MKTFLKGYEDKLGSGKPVVIAGTEVPIAKQVEIFNDAKRLHKFPKGINRLVMVREQELDCALFSDPETAKALQLHDETYKKSEVEKQRVLKEVESKAEERKAALARITDAALARNSLMGEVHVIESQLRNISITPENLKEKGWHKLEAELKTKLESAKVKLAEAVKTFETVSANTKEVQEPQSKNKNTINI